MSNNALIKIDNTKLSKLDFTDEMFNDSLLNLANQLTNQRNALFQNQFYSFNSWSRNYQELRALYKNGLMNKIIRLKTESIMKTDGLIFENEKDKEIFVAKVKPLLSEAIRWMLAFGRGIITVQNIGDDISKPLNQKEIDINTCILRVFSGDIVSVTGNNIGNDLENARFLKPVHYNVWGRYIHWTRVIDFTYVKPPDFELPYYQYGGISEIELIKQQIEQDGILQRAGVNNLEKSATFVIKYDGFRNAIKQNKQDEIIKYTKVMEDRRSIYGTLIIDNMDEAQVVNQTLQGLQDLDTLTLRRIAMVTSIPVAILVGENVKGLNSSGENEMKIFDQTIENLITNYVETHVSELASILNIGNVTFKLNQGFLPEEKLTYESKALDNALKLSQLSEDYKEYLVSKGITKQDTFTELWGNDDEEEIEQQNGELE